VRAGAILFVIGALATLATVTPLFIGVHPLPTAAYLVSMLMAVGFALALVGLLRSALEQRCQATSVGVIPPASPDATPPDGVPGK
jgi:ABC-type Na+ efflux pump permease subunit